MEFRTIGSSGLKVSVLGVGCNNFGGRLGKKASHAVIHAALDQGVTLFDTADVYPMGAGGTSEELLGSGLGKRRGDVVVATKFGMKMDKSGRREGGSRRYIMRAVEDSLKRLGTDWIDLLQFHKPDPDTPVEETLRALDDLIRAGKVRYVGCSNFSAWQMVEAHFIARELGLNRFICTQDEYSLLVRGVEDEILPVCERYGMGFLPFFPLASGVLTGKYATGKPIPEGTRLAKSEVLAGRFLGDENLAIADRLAAIASARGLGLIDIAFSYLLKSLAVPSVIAGASNREQIERNAEAAASAMDDELYAEIREALGA